MASKHRNIVYKLFRDKLIEFFHSSTLAFFAHFHFVFSAVMKLSPLPEIIKPKQTHNKEEESKQTANESQA